LVFAAPAGGAVAFFEFDDKALRSQIGYATHHSLREGIEKTAAVYQRAAARGTIHA